MKMKQTLLGLALTAALVLPASAARGLSAPAAQALSVNGKDLWSGARARVVDDVTYVSLRTVSEELAPQARVEWKDGEARVRGKGVDLTARPGDQWLTVNDRALYIPGGVLAEDGAVLVPVRALAQALGGQVDWSREAGVSLTPGSGTPDPAPYTEDELYWMARIISAESRGEPLLGKLAVGTVVLNRVADEEFPDSIYDVIFDRKWGVQFAPVANGTIYLEPTEESVLAAKLVLDGARAAGDSLYFLAPDLTDNHWIMENQSYVTTIGCHWFYR